MDQTADELKQAKLQHSNPKQIRGEIERTRLEMTATMVALQERLDPARLREQVTETARYTATQRAQGIAHTTKRTAGDFRSTASQLVRQQPAVAATLASGLGLLAVWGVAGRRQPDGSRRMPMQYGPSDQIQLRQIRVERTSRMTPLVLAALTFAVTTAAVLARRSL